ncbi:MAG: hypothetical protein IPI29_04610 [Ignavibacteria bacterium]|nr:hypothetical protein [Ignavibacteria bacterium]
MRSVPIAIMFVGILIASCTNDTVNPDPQQNVDETALSAIGALVAGSSTSEDVHGALGMLHWRLDGAEGRDDVYHTSGSVFDTDSPFAQKRVNGGMVNISGVSIAADPLNDQFYESSLGGLWDRPDAPYSIAGNVLIPTFETTLAVPKKIVLNNSIAGKTLSRSVPLTLTWNTDSNNANGVRVVISYRVFTSNKENSAMPDTAITINVLVPDNGSNTFSTKELSVFPTGAIVDIGIGRGASKVTGSPRKYLVSATTIAFGECVFGA